MTLDEAKLLNVGDICKDLGKSGLYGKPVYCKVKEISTNDVTFEDIDNHFPECFPHTILFRMVENTIHFDKVES